MKNPRNLTGRGADFACLFRRARKLRVQLLMLDLQWPRDLKCLRVS